MYTAAVAAQSVCGPAMGEGVPGAEMTVAAAVLGVEGPQAFTAVTEMVPDVPGVAITLFVVVLPVVDQPAGNVQV